MYDPGASYAAYYDWVLVGADGTSEVKALLEARGRHAELVASAGRFSLFQLRNSNSERGSLTRGAQIGTLSP